MTIIILVICVLLIVLTTHFCLRLRAQLRMDWPELAPVDVPSEGLAPLPISVLIPARDEERGIRSCALSALAQRCAETIVYNDMSADKTPQILSELTSRNPSLRVIHGGKPRRGWTGKNNALDHLARSASCPWLLFIDADVTIAPGAVAASIEYAEANHLDALSCLGHRDAASFWANVMEPIWPCLLSFVMGTLRRISSNDVGASFASGAWLLVKRSSYEASGGFAMLRSAIVEDCTLFRLLKRSGAVVRVVQAPALYRVRMYESLTDLLRGWSKNCYPLLRMLDQSAAKIALVMVLLVLCTVAPWLIAGVALFDSTVCWPAKLGALASVGWSLGGAVALRKACGRPLPFAWTTPIAGVLVAAIVARSAAFATGVRGVIWKGRRYDDSNGQHTGIGIARANFFDRLMLGTQLTDAPVWITLLATVEELPDIEKLKSSLRDLVAETGRLRVRWNPTRSGWEPYIPTRANIDSMLRTVEADTPEELLAKLVTSPVDIESESLLRVTYGRCGTGPTLIGFQLHHALGDVRALGYLLRRLWQHYARETNEEGPNAPAYTADYPFLRTSVARLRRWRYLFDRRLLLSASRGISLRQSASPLGSPLYRSISKVLTPVSGHIRLSAGALAHGAILSAISTLTYDRPDSSIVRLRIPVDLRGQLRTPTSVGNYCTNVMVELSLSEIRERKDDAFELAALVPNRLSHLLRNGAHWLTTIECYLLGRYLPLSFMRRAVSESLGREPCASTFDITYLGEVDWVFERAPFGVLSLRGHTPMVGAISFVFKGTLSIEVLSFEGFWSTTVLSSFCDELDQWLSAAAALEGLAPSKNLS